MTALTFIILLGVALIDGKLWRMMAAQKAHHQKVETLLTEIREAMNRK